MKRLDELKNIIIRAKEEYYNTGESFLSDEEYDSIEKEYENLSNSLVEIGTSSEHHFKKIPHKIPMGSQSKIINENELYIWLKKTKYNNHKLLVEHKLDGISVSINYKNGKLDSFITRGDGWNGYDVTNNLLLHIKTLNVPEYITITEDVSIRGEILVSKDTFEMYLKDLNYSNPRNAAAGITNRIDGKYCEYLSLVVYDITGKFSSEIEKLEILKDLNFNIVDYIICNDSDYIFIYQKEILEQRDNIKYEIDGLVIKYDEFSLSSIINDDLRPEYQIALKFPNRMFASKIVDLEWSMGNSGIYTPIALFETRNIAGANISRASLANYGRFKELTFQGLGKDSDILIARNNDVIPYLHKVVTSSEQFSVPDTCYYCNEPLILDDVFLKCNNKNCKHIEYGRLVSFVNNLGIYGLNKKTLQLFQEKDIIKHPLDIFNIKNYKKYLYELEGFGYKSVTKLLESIDKHRNFSIEIFFGSLGISEWGCKSFKKLFQNYNIVYNDYGELQLYQTQIISIDGFSNKMYESLKKDSIKFQEEIKDFFKLVSKYDLHINIPRNVSNSSLKVCQTGSLYEFKNRKDLISFCDKNLIEFKSSISKDLDYLISNEKSSSSKYTKAEKLKIPIISELEFLDLIKSIIN